MRKKAFTNIISIITVAALLSTSVFAFEPNERFISIEEYELALNEVCEEYGITCTVLEYDESCPITEDNLASSIELARRIAESTTVSEVALQDPDGTITNQVQVIPVQRTRYKSFQVANIYGSAYIKVTGTVTYDAQNNRVNSIGSYSAYQSGSFVNFDSWTTTSISYSMNSPSRGYVTYYVSGIAVFSYSDPITGIKTGYTKEVSNQPVDINFN